MLHSFYVKRFPQLISDLDFVRRLKILKYKIYNSQQLVLITSKETLL